MFPFNQRCLSIETDKSTSKQVKQVKPRKKQQKSWGTAMVGPIRVRGAQGVGNDPWIVGFCTSIINMCIIYIYIFVYIIYTLPETNGWHVKRWHFQKEKVILQLSINFLVLKSSFVSGRWFTSSSSDLYWFYPTSFGGVIRDLFRGESWPPLGDQKVTWKKLDHIHYHHQYHLDKSSCHPGYTCWISSMFIWLHVYADTHHLVPSFWSSWFLKNFRCNFRLRERRRLPCQEHRVVALVLNTFSMP